MLLVLALAAVLLLVAVAPAVAAPSTPEAAQPGLHIAHCATMGTPGHMKVPFACPMPHAECMGAM